MVNFPSITLPSYPFSTKIENVALQSKMEDGTIVSRARFTRARETFTLRWNALPEADYILLLNFYKNTVKGGSLAFIWTHPPVPGSPPSGVPYTVRFIDGDIEFSVPQPGIRSGQLVLQEV